MRRRELKNEKIIERETLINAREEREKRKDLARENAMKDTENPENPEENNFNEEAFSANFDSNDPVINIPEEIGMDLDDDFDIMIL